jgi:putative methyltransferase (TIGR04325 family)
MAACGPGYEDPALVEIVYRKAVGFRDTMLHPENLPELPLDMLRVMPLLSIAARGDRLRVVDFGGACGFHYFMAKAILGSAYSLQWFVVETKGMATRARSLEDGQLCFFHNLDEAREAMGKPDVVFSSGTLQYLADPCATLEELTACGARYMLLTRVGLLDGKSTCYGVQVCRYSENGFGPLPESFADGTVRYPLSLVARSSLESVLAKRYRVLVRIAEEKPAYRVGQTTADMFGYWAERVNRI